MSAVQVSDGFQYLAQLPCDGGLAGSGVTRQYDVDAGLLLLTQSTLGTLYVVMDGVCYLPDGTLDLVHANVAFQVAQDIFQRPLFRHVAANVLNLYGGGCDATTDERREDVFCRLDGDVTIAERVVFRLHLMLEIAAQLALSLRRVRRDAVFVLQFQLTNVAQFLTTRCRQSEGVLETVLCCWVGGQEVVQSLGQSGNDDNGVLVPLVHLDKELVQRIHLIGVAVWQQLLHIVKEEDAPLGFLDVVVPLVNKALVVDGIDHRQFGFVDDFMLIEIVAYHLCQGCLAGTRLADDDGIHAQAHLHDVLSGMKVGIGVNDGLQLLLDIVEAYHAVQHILNDKRLTAPLAELGYLSVFPMTLLTYHIILRPFEFVR